MLHLSVKSRDAWWEHVLSQHILPVSCGGLPKTPIEADAKQAITA